MLQRYARNILPPLLKSEEVLCIKSDDKASTNEHTIRYFEYQVQYFERGKGLKTLEQYQAHPIFSWVTLVKQQEVNVLQ